MVRFLASQPATGVAGAGAAPQQQQQQQETGGKGSYKNPPTPADARGSAPGNNTFDPCFGLLPLLQQLQQQQQPAAAGSGWCVPIWQLFFERKEQEQQDEKGVKSIIFFFLWVSEVTLGTFSPPFLRLLRPSLPWCFPVRGLWFCAVFPRLRTAFWSGTSSSEISSFSMGFRSYVRHFFAPFFAPSPSFTAMVFPCLGAVVLRALSSPKNRVLERDK